MYTKFKDQKEIGSYCCTNLPKITKPQRTSNGLIDPFLNQHILQCFCQWKKLSCFIRGSHRNAPNKINWQYLYHKLYFNYNDVENNWYLFLYSQSNKENTIIKAVILLPGTILPYSVRFSEHVDIQVWQCFILRV